MTSFTVSFTVSLAVSFDLRNAISFSTALCTLFVECEELRAEKVKLTEYLQLEKNRHAKTFVSNTDIQRYWSQCQPLLQVGKEGRNGFMENVHRHHSTGNFVALYNANPKPEIVKTRNIAVHEGNFLAI